jgi:hypothetical protein
MVRYMCYIGSVRILCWLQNLLTDNFISTARKVQQCQIRRHYEQYDVVTERSHLCIQSITKYCGSPSAAGLLLWPEDFICPTIRTVTLFFQSVVMLMFREEKSPEDEIKAWQFWHGRQHSVKQRILDAGEAQFHISDGYSLTACRVQHC